MYDSANPAPGGAPKPRTSGRAVVGIVLGILITALLTFLLLPAFTKMREPAYRTACANNLHQIGMAVSAYAADNGGSFPPDLGRLYPEYVDNAKTFSCPISPSEWKEIPKTRRFDRTTTGYVHVAGLREGDPPTCVLAFDRPGNHGEKSKHPTPGPNVCTLDTRVRWRPEAELQKALAETREYARKQGREIRLVGE